MQFKPTMNKSDGMDAISGIAKQMDTVKEAVNDANVKGLRVPISRSPSQVDVSGLRTHHLEQARPVRTAMYINGSRTT